MQAYYLREFLMNSRIHLELQIDSFQSIRVSKEIDLFELKEPLHLGNHKELSLLNTPNRTVERIYCLRKNLSEQLANDLSKLILQSLKSRDTFNGYPIEETNNGKSA